jgi:hypothetical protein
VRRRAILVLPEGQCPHPRRSYWRSGYFQDATNDNAIGKYVESQLTAASAESAASSGTAGVYPGGFHFARETQQKKEIEGKTRRLCPLECHWNQ